MSGYPYGRRFGSKIARADRKEGNGVGVGPATEQSSTTCSVTGPTPTPSPSFLLAQAIFKPNLLPFGYPNNSQIYSFYTYLPMKMEQTVFRNVGI